MTNKCKCGCGEIVKNEWVRGHVSRVRNNWGHNQKAIENSANTRRKQYKNGERKVWNDGLTKETDNRLADAGLKISKSFTDDRRKEYAEIMKKHRLDGTIPTLHGPDSSQWKGGTSPLSAKVYGSNRLYTEWKYPILKKAGFKCEKCQSKLELHVHHNKEKMSEIISELMDFDKIIDYHIYNKVSGIVLCKDRHKDEHPSLNF